MKINKPINIKIGFYFFITNIIILLLLGGIFYFSSSNLLIKKEILGTKEAIERRGNYIELYLAKLTALSEVLGKDRNIYNFLKNKAKNKNDIMETINNILLIDPAIKSIVLIGKDGRIVSNEKNINMSISKNMMKEEWYLNSLKNSMPVLNPLRKQKFSNDNMNDWVISLSREITDKDGANLGVLLFDIKYEILHKYLQGKEISENGDIFILNRDGRVVYHKNVPCTEREKHYLEKFLYAKTGYNLKTNQVFVNYPIKKTNWHLIGISSLKEIYSLKIHFFQLLTFSTIMSLFITYLINAFILSRITKPIKELEEHMSKFSNNLSKITLKGDKSLEIISLEKHFNEMIEKINYLREYEINALYSQINPHFLYNTLDTIIWMAEFQDTEKVISITKALAKFFQISLSNGREKITLKEEIHHVKEYLYIQKQRYEEKLEYFIEVPKELDNIEVPKIILQPLVENSIYHGIKELNGLGVIRIYGKIYSDHIKLIVEDNGVGFGSIKNKGLKIGGVGITNVNKRINFYYGENYGISINKQIKQGAQVIITLPKINIER